MDWRKSKSQPLLSIKAMQTAYIYLWEKTNYLWTIDCIYSKISTKCLSNQTSKTEYTTQTHVWRRQEEEIQTLPQLQSWVSNLPCYWSVSIYYTSGMRRSNKASNNNCGVYILHWPCVIMHIFWSALILHFNAADIFESSLFNTAASFMKQSQAVIGLITAIHSWYFQYF